MTGRYDHSLSIWKQGGGKGTSVIVFGGLNKDYLPLSNPEIIELGKHIDIILYTAKYNHVDLIRPDSA